MWRSPNWAEGHYIDLHTKYNCWKCGKDFIVGEKLLDDCLSGYPVCPYCGSKDVEDVVGTDEEHLEELADFMGCLGIYVNIDEE